MVNFIVLGQIPGTSVRLGFVSVLAMMFAVLAAYVLREKEKALLRKSKETRLYTRAAAMLRPLWLNYFKPKLDVLEQKAILVPEFAVLLEHFKASRAGRKSA